MLQNYFRQYAGMTKPKIPTIRRYNHTQNSDNAQMNKVFPPRNDVESDFYCNFAPYF